jgi:hypothetical protein
MPKDKSSVNEVNEVKHTDDSKEESHPFVLSKESEETESDTELDSEGKIPKINPVDVPIPRKEPVRKIQKELTPKEEILNRINRIILEEGGESNIPFNSEYWFLLKEYRRMK